MKKAQGYSSPYELEGRIPLGQAILFGLLHVMAMFVGNLTPVLLITGACALDGGLQLKIIQNAMLVAGLVTLVQLFTIEAGWRKTSYCYGNKLRIYRSVQRCGIHHGTGDRHLRSNHFCKLYWRSV